MAFLSYRASVGNPIVSLMVADSHLSREGVESIRRMVGEVRIDEVVPGSLGRYKCEWLFYDRMEGIHVVVPTLSQPGIPPLPPALYIHPSGFSAMTSPACLNRLVLLPAAFIAILVNRVHIEGRG